VTTARVRGTPPAASPPPFLSIQLPLLRFCAAPVALFPLSKLSSSSCSQTLHARNIELLTAGRDGQLVALSRLGRDDANLEGLLELLCSRDAVLSFAAAEALRRVRLKLGRALPERLVDQNSVCALRLLKTLLRDEGESGGATTRALASGGLARCLAAAAGDEERLLFACKLARSFLGRREAPRSVPEAILDATGQLLPLSATAYARHACLTTLTVLLEQRPACAAACADALARHCCDLLSPPAPGCSRPSSPFSPTDDGLRRRALLLALLCAGEAPRPPLPPCLVADWQRALLSVDDAAGALAELLDAEDDIYLRALAAAASLHPKLEGPAAALCDPGRLLALLCLSTRYDAAVLVDMLMAESAVPLLSLLVAALRRAAENDVSRALLEGEALAELHSLRERLSRLAGASLFPFNIAPLIRRLALLEAAQGESTG